MNPDTVREVKEKAAALKNKEGKEDTPESRKAFFTRPLEELKGVFKSDFLPFYYQSIQYRQLNKHPSGRMWRVLKMAFDARTVCTKIELELANVLEIMAKEKEMKTSTG